MSAIVALPLVWPLCAAVGAFLAFRTPRAQEVISITASVALVVTSFVLLAHVRAEGLLVTQVGSWPAPYGVSLVADRLSATMVCITSVLGLAVAIYSIDGVSRRRRAFGFHPLLQLVLAGVCGAFLTGDLFNLFVWIEVQLIASFVLLALGGERAQLEGAIKYVTLNLVSSALMLAAIGLLYGLCGTLNFADMAVRLERASPSGAIGAAALLLFAAFGIKAAIFPFFFWLPASYHTPPAAVSALFSGLLTKVGVYAMARVFVGVYGGELAVLRDVLFVVAALTMVTGVLGAAAQNDVRRILSFHVVSQIGYMVMGIALGTVLGVGGAIYFVLHNIAAKSALFLVAGVIEREQGTGDLSRLGGLARTRPGLAMLFLVPALSLAGIPPLAGFVGKLLLVRAGLDARAWLLVATALVVSLLTLYSMAKIWIGAFWSPAPETPVVASPRRAPVTMHLGVVGMVLVTILLSVLAEPAVALSLGGAEQLLDRGSFVDAVLATTAEVPSP
ncbi:proton-conducting transporter membrane subunit [Sandaracinus amylolyticus]|uniref:Na(+) H(+) antiporter subunit D n=1 Tax=Sandaracinus amylolyticus TaxID=927083 RepID=A0A0F6W6D9_9BACT|nr:proton-conducting transporter membrane subunit [Sandaracinus amylolyticus]AKF08650.1 Na(+) H(+) antiporter subunit D [Sandaracinus amylolyticus]